MNETDNNKSQSVWPDYGTHWRLRRKKWQRSATSRTEQYLLLESGTVDISVSVLHQISQAYGVELTTLMFGDEPKMSTYFITRNGKGVAVERTKAYKYQSLAAGFRRT